MSQCDRLIDYMQFQPITPMEAWNELGIYRLAARIHEIREQGYAITRENVEVTNRYGETCRVAQYSLGA